jgi:hypothetical protein
VSILFFILTADENPVLSDLLVENASTSQQLMPNADCKIVVSASHVGRR